MILLTGASGYLGSQIAQELICRGESFRVLARDPSRLPFDPAACGCEVVVGELNDGGALAAAVKGVRYVIHSAGLVKMWVRDKQKFWRVNVRGLKALLEEAACAGVERVVYTSSFIAAGPSANPDAGEGLKASAPYFNEYHETKSIALNWLRTEGFARYPVVAMLPGVIYGPGPATEGNLVGGMVERYLKGTFPALIGNGSQRWSFAVTTEVAQAHINALSRGKAGEEYFLAGDNRSLNDFYRILAKQTRVHRHVWHLSFAVGKMVGSVEVASARLLGQQPELTPGVVEIFRHDWVYSSAKAIRELGYRVVPLEEGLRKTLEARRG